MILVVEPAMHGTGHSAINAGIISSLRAAFPRQPLRFAAEAEHLAEVQRLLGAAPLMDGEFRPIVPPAIGTLPVQRAWQLWRLFRRLLDEVDDGGPILVVVTCNNGPEMHLGEYFANRPRYRGRLWFQFMLHGPDAAAFTWRTRHPLHRLLDLPGALARPRHPALRWLVLDGATLPSLEALAPGIAARTGVLNIALLESEQALAGPAPVALTPLRIALPGQATAPKGIHSFVRIANALAPRFGKRVEFHLVGRLAADAADTDLGAVMAHTEGAQLRRQKAMQLPRADYLRLLRSMHYVCLPYQGSYYHTGASGVFYDAINLSRPMLVMPAPHVAESFEQFGDIGHLCADEAALGQAIENLLEQHDEARYREQQRRLDVMREAFMPAAVGARFRAWLRADSPDLAQALG